MIHNGDLMPRWIPSDKVKTEGEYTPEWIKTLIMMEVRLEIATDEGTLEAAVKVLDHAQEMGVNGLWITPIADRQEIEGRNGYDNFGLDTLYPGLTGTTDYDEGIRRYKRFVDEAHKRNIYIIQDIVSWGLNPKSPLIKERPELFDGNPDVDWGGVRYDWTKPETREWYIDYCVNFVLQTGVDGLRYDAEPNPNYAGRAGHLEIRRRLKEKGIHICSMAELSNINDEYKDAYDFEQIGVLEWYSANRHKDAPPYFIGYHNIVDSVRYGYPIGAPNKDGVQGNNRFYTFNIADHDCWQLGVNRNLLVIGYQAILAPFIPLWWLGEEWNSGKYYVWGAPNYFGKTNWLALEEAENNRFYEDVKALIRVRRSHPEIFEYFPEDHRKSNIERIVVEGGTGIGSYMRYAGNTAILVCASNRPANEVSTHKVDVANAHNVMGKPECDYFCVKDAITGELIVEGPGYQVGRFEIDIHGQNMRVLELTVSPSLQKEEDA